MFHNILDSSAQGKTHLCTGKASVQRHAELSPLCSCKEKERKRSKKKSKSSMYAADRACDKTNEKSKEQEQIAVKMASVQMRLNRTTVVEGSTEGKASCDCLAEESKLVH